MRGQIVTTDGMNLEVYETLHEAFEQADREGRFGVIWTLCEEPTGQWVETRFRSTNAIGYIVHPRQILLKPGTTYAK